MPTMRICIHGGWHWPAGGVLLGEMPGATMRDRKRKAGLIPRAPWSEDGRRAYYDRQEKRNKYPNPNEGREGVTYAGYMQTAHPEEWAILCARRAGNVTRARKSAGRSEPGKEPGSVTRARKSAAGIVTRARNPRAAKSATGAGNVTRSGAVPSECNEI